jgi:hypothetical protein
MRCNNGRFTGIGSGVILSWLLEEAVYINKTEVAGSEKFLIQQTPKYALAVRAKHNEQFPEALQEKRDIALKLALEGIADASIDSLDRVESLHLSMA